MRCSEEATFTADYHDPEKRSIANSLTLTLSDGSTFTETVEYPLGHRRRRSEGIPLLEAKFRTNLNRRFAPPQQQAILDASLDQQALERMPVQDYVNLYAL
jgi:2-methylcitrate dehydratase